MTYAATAADPTVIIAELSRYAPFDAMARAELEFLARSALPATYPVGTVIIDPAAGPPDRLHIVRQGAVEVVAVSAPSGASPLVLHAGDVFPLGALLERRAARDDYRVSLEATCLVLSEADFRVLLERSPPFRSFCTERVLHVRRQALTGLRSDVGLHGSEPEPLNLRLHEIVRRAPLTCAPELSIREVLEALQREGVGSMLVTAADARPVGIFTTRDVLDRVTLAGVPLSAPIESVMSPNPVSLPSDAFGFEAALKMSEHGIRHVVVTTDDRVAGLVSERDLFALQRVGIAALSAAISKANSTSLLPAIARDIHALGRNLLAQGVDAEHIAQILTALNDRLTQRVIALELEKNGVNEISLCWISLGSEGRREQTFATDQDNGIIFADPANDDPNSIRACLVPLAASVNRTLAQLGFPLCRGDIMAGNPKWCLSESEWRERFLRWITMADPDAILHATIFFDFRPLWGDGTAATRLRAWLTDAARDAPRFLHLLAENALTNRPPLGIVRDFAWPEDAAHPDAMDLKVNGATLFVDAARVLALASGVAATGTIARLREVASVRGIPEREVEAWTAAFKYLQLIRLRHQGGQLARHEAPDNFVNPDRLHDLDRRLLKESLRAARRLQQRVALDHHL